MWLSIFSHISFYLIKKKKYLFIWLCQTRASLVAQTVKRVLAMQETWVRSLGREDPLEKEMATHSSSLGWKIPWMKEPGRLQSRGWHRVRQTEQLHWSTGQTLAASCRILRYGVGALEYVGSVVAVGRLSCPEACGILVPPAIEPTSAALQGGFLITREVPVCFCFYVNCLFIRFALSFFYCLVFLTLIYKSFYVLMR